MVSKKHKAKARSSVPATSSKQTNPSLPIAADLEPETSLDNTQDGEEQHLDEQEEDTDATLKMTASPPEPDNIYELLQPFISNSLLSKISKDTENGSTKHIIFKSGHTFTGTIKHGQLHGRGTFVWKNETKYRGDFENNHVQGEGEMVWPNGDTYSGGFAKGLRHGTGTFKCADTGAMYDGEWKDGLRHGQGRTDLSNGCMYAGDWVQGKRHGHGCIKYANGNEYVGDWSTGQRCGFGEMKWVGREKQVYRGQWEAGLPHGYGECVWFDKGTLLNEINVGTNKRQLTSSLEGKEDVVIVVAFDQADSIPATEENQRERSTKLVNWYRGSWVKGLREGRGSFHFADGSLYSGSFEQDKKHGLDGTFVFVDGRVYYGAFEHDVMVGPAPEKPDDTPGSLRVELSIDDISPVVVGLETLANKRSVDHVLLRWKASLRAWFTLCSQTTPPPMGLELQGGARGAAAASAAAAAAGAHSPKAARADSIWAFLLKCRVPDARISLAYVNRILVFLQTRHVSAATAVAPSQPEATESFPDAAEIRVHDPARLILFREFMELLVRIAHEKYRFDYSTLAERFTRLVSQDIALAYLCNSGGSSSNNNNSNSNNNNSQTPRVSGTRGSRQSILSADVLAHKNMVKVWAIAQGVNRVLELVGKASTHPSTVRLGQLLTVPLLNDYTTTPRAVIQLLRKIGATKFEVRIHDKEVKVEKNDAKSKNDETETKSTVDLNKLQKENFDVADDGGGQVEGEQEKEKEDEVEQHEPPVTVEISTWMVLDATRTVLAGCENEKQAKLKKGERSVAEAASLLEHELTEIELSKVLELVSACACENAGLILNDERTKVWNCLLNMLAPVSQQNKCDFAC